MWNIKKLKGFFLLLSISRSRSVPIHNAPLAFWLWRKGRILKMISNKNTF